MWTFRESCYSACMLWVVRDGKEDVLFNNALNTFYLWLYGIGHKIMLKNHSDSEKRNLPLCGLLILNLL